MSSQNVVTLKGTLLAGPPKSSCANFPSGLVNATFELRPPNKNAAVLAHHLREVSSPSAFVELAGVGSDQAVTHGTVLYLRTSAKMVVRTTTNGDSGDEVAVQYVDGLFVMELPTTNYLKALEVQGTGTLEYFVSGPQ